MARAKTNEYVECMVGLTAMMPKNVAVAVLISTLMRDLGTEQIGEVEKEIIREWIALYNNGIVPNKPPNLGD